MKRTPIVRNLIKIIQPLLFPVLIFGVGCNMPVKKEVNPPKDRREPVEITQSYIPTAGTILNDGSSIKVHKDTLYFSDQNIETMKFSKIGANIQWIKEPTVKLPYFSTISISSDIGYGLRDQYVYEIFHDKFFVYWEKHRYQMIGKTFTDQTKAVFQPRQVNVKVGCCTWAHGEDMDRYAIIDGISDNQLSFLIGSAIEFYTSDELKGTYSGVIRYDTTHKNFLFIPAGAGD